MHIKNPSVSWPSLSQSIPFCSSKEWASDPCPVCTAPQQSPSQLVCCGDVFQRDGDLFEDKACLAISASLAWGQAWPRADNKATSVQLTGSQGWPKATGCLLIHTLAGEEEMVTPLCGFLAFFASAVDRRSMQFCLIKQNRKYYPYVL